MTEWPWSWMGKDLEKSIEASSEGLRLEIESIRRELLSLSKIIAQDTDPGDGVKEALDVLAARMGAIDISVRRVGDDVQEVATLTWDLQYRVSLLELPREPERSYFSGMKEYLKRMHLFIVAAFSCGIAAAGVLWLLSMSVR